MSLAGKISQVPSDDEVVPFLEADGVGLALVLLGSLPLAWRRLAPLPVLAVTAISAFLVESLGYAPPPLPFAVLVALFTVAEVLSYQVSAAATGAVVASLAVVALAGSGTFTDDKFLAYLLSIVATWVAGYWLRLSRGRAAQVEQIADLERQAQTARTRLAVEQERERIARELHDLVSNSVCLIIGQAGSARRQCSAQQEPVRQALASVEATGREALAELRQLLRVLGTEDPAAERGPRLRLDDLPQLLARVEQAGLPVAPHRPGRGPVAAGRRRSRRVPDRPGGADEQRAARRRDPRRGAARLLGGQAAGADRRRRPGQRPARGRRARDDRHAGTDHPARRESHDRVGGARRVRAGGHPAPGR